MANFTSDGNFTYKLKQGPSQLQAGMLTFILAFNVFLSITASLGNALILITKLFFRCLAVTDLCVGLIVQPLRAANLVSHLGYLKGDAVYYISKAVWALSVLLCGVSVLTTTAISVDRLALLLGLRYRHFVTLMRVRIAITCFWLFCTLSGTIRWWTDGVATKVTSVVVTLSVVTSIYCYTRIHLKLRHQQDQVQSHDNQVAEGSRNSQMNIARYRKTVCTIFWVQLALGACYIPWAIMVVLRENDILTSKLAWKTAAALVFSNSSLNPILYCWKITEVKQAVKDTIKQPNCFLRNESN